jgi:hypothetical protein
MQQGGSPAQELHPAVLAQQAALRRPLICMQCTVHGPAPAQVLARDDDVRCGALADVEAIRERVGDQGMGRGC